MNAARRAAFWVFLSALGAGLLLSARDAQAKLDEAALKKLLPAVASYKAGQSRKALIEVQKMVADAAKDPKDAAAAARHLAALLESPQATREVKDFVCRQLWIIGTAEQVPILAKLLGDEKLAHMARYAMERMPDPAVDAALRQALGRLKGKLLVGVIGSIGERRDAKATDALIRLLRDKDTMVAAAAGAALGKIGGQPAASAIGAARGKTSGRLRNVLTEAWLGTAESLLAAGKKAEAARIYDTLYASSEPRHVRVAALGGRLKTMPPAEAAKLLIGLIRGKDAKLRVVAVRHLSRVPGKQVTAQVAALLPKAEPALQSLLIGVLAARSDAAAAPAIVALARDSKDEQVRLAAVRALARVGDASAARLLGDVAASSKGALRDAARHTLSRLPGKATDAAILDALNGASEAARVELVRSLRARQATAQVERIAQVAATDKSAAVRGQCFTVLGELAGAKHLSQLTELMLKEADSSARGSAERAVLAVARRVEDPAKRLQPVLNAHAKATGAGRVAVLRVLSRLGGAEALAAVRRDLRHQDAAVAEGALRALTVWPDGSAADALLPLVRSAKNPTLRILALRGLIRALGLASGRSAAQTVQGYKQALELARRTSEKKLALSGLASVAHADALTLARSCAKDPALKAEAEQAAAKIKAALAAKRTPPKKRPKK